MTFISKATKDFFYYINKELEKEKNKKNIASITSYFSKIILERFSPYFYTLLCILLIMFVMNCVQFYYYLKIILKIDKYKLTSMSMSVPVSPYDLITTIN